MHRALLLCILTTLALASCTRLLQDDPVILEILQSSKSSNPNRSFFYSPEEIRDITQTYYPTNYPIFNSFNDPDVRQQLRKNFIIICDQMLSFASAGLSVPPERLDDILTLRSLYNEDEAFNSRQIPKYYHVTHSYNNLTSILASKHVLATKALFPGAWTANGFYLRWSSYYILAFSSDLELPTSEVSPQSHFLSVLPRSFNYFGLGRVNDINFFKTQTNLVSWATILKDYNKTTEYIRTLDNEAYSFYSSKGLTNVQMILERQIVSLAQIYSSDRANSLLMGALQVNYTWTTTFGANLTFGEVIYCRAFNQTTFSLYLKNYAEGKLLILGASVPNRLSLKYVVVDTNCYSTNMFLPDVAITDGMTIIQLVADARLVPEPPSYRKLNDSIKHISKHISTVQLEIEDLYEAEN